MSNVKFDEIWQNFSEAQSEEEQYAIMKDFMLNASSEDLWAWNRYLREQEDNDNDEQEDEVVSDKTN